MFAVNRGVNSGGLEYNCMQNKRRRCESMIAVEIDELTPCLKDNNTGAILETEVIRI